MKKFNTITTLLFATIISTALFAANGSWTFDGDGSWTNDAMWAGGTVPNGTGDNAYFTNTYVDDKIIATLGNSQNITVGGIYLKNTRVQLPDPAHASGVGTNITLDAGGGLPIIDVFTNRLDIQCILEGTDGFTAYGSSITGVPAGILMLGATAKPISGTATFSNLNQTIINNKDALVNTDVVLDNALLNSRKNEFNSKTITVLNGGGFNVFQTDDTSGAPVKVQADSITINSNGVFGAGNDPIWLGSGESFDLLSPSITVNNGGRIKVNGGNAKSVGGNSITVANGGEVGFFNNFFTYTISNPLVLDGWGIAPSLGALTVQGLNNLTNNSPITLAGNTRIGMWGGGDNYMIMNEPISGTGPLILLAQGGHYSHIRRFELHAANDYTGNTTIQGFACQNITTLHGNNRLPNTTLTLELSNWTMDLTNTFNLNGYDQDLQQLIINAGAGLDEVRIVGDGGTINAAGVGNYGALMNGAGVSLHGVTFDAGGSIIALRNDVALTVTGSTVRTTGPSGYLLMNHGGLNSYLNVGEDGLVDVQLLRMADMTDPENLSPVVNLNAGGTIQTSLIWVDGTNAPDAIFRFNGGLLENHESSTFDDNWIWGDHSTVIADGGANISVDRDMTIQAPLLHDPAASAIDGGLTKLGYESLTLSNTCNYTGPTVVSEGTLIVNTLGESKLLAVDDGATVGDVSGTLTIPANTTVSPGSSVGTMYVQSNLVMQSGSIYDWEVGAFYAADLIDSDGSLDLSGAAANSITVNVNVISDLLSDDTNVLFMSSGIIGDASSIYMSYSIGNSGPENPMINGNNIEITDIIIPEPGIISIVCLLAFAFIGRKK